MCRNCGTQLIHFWAQTNINPKWQFLSCASIAFSERYLTLLFSWSHHVRSIQNRPLHVSTTFVVQMLKLRAVHIYRAHGNSTMGTGSFPGAKRPGHSADHPPQFKCRGHERVGLYLYSPSGTQWPVIGRISLHGNSSPQWIPLRSVCWRSTALCNSLSHCIRGGSYHYVWQSETSNFTDLVHRMSWNLKHCISGEGSVSAFKLAFSKTECLYLYIVNVYILIKYELSQISEYNIFQ